MNDDEFNAARGIVTACLASLALWVAVIVGALLWAS